MHLFFHVRAAGRIWEDPEGAEFGTLEAAREEAIWSARDMMAERLRQGRPLDGGDQFEISDHTGQVLLVVLFEDAIPKE